MLALVGHLCVLALVAAPTCATVLQLVRSGHTANYTDYLASLPQDANVVIEFYSPWCPSCSAFKPTYDEVGSHFMDVPSPVVHVARVNCAGQEIDECTGVMRINVFPTVTFGTPQQFVAALRVGIVDAGLLVPRGEHTRSAQDIIQDVKEYFEVPDTDVHDGNLNGAAGTARPAGHGILDVLGPAWHRAAVLWSRTTTAVLRLVPSTPHAGRGHA